jgi:hypothetical protein
MTSRVKRPRELMREACRIGIQNDVSPLNA